MYKKMSFFEFKKRFDQKYNKKFLLLIDEETWKNEYKKLLYYYII